MKKENMKPRKILIAVPCMDQVAAPFAHSLANLTAHGIQGTEISVWFNIGSLIYMSRDELARMALYNGADLVMWLDSDMTFPRDTMERLLAHIDAGADMATGVYYRRKKPYSPTIYTYLEIDPEKMTASWEELHTIHVKEPFEVSGAGFGCVLMKAEVLATVFARTGNMFAPIIGIGEDLSFCWRARKCGYRIIADPSIPLGHVGTKIYGPEDYRRYISEQDECKRAPESVQNSKG